MDFTTGLWLWIGSIVIFTLLIPMLIERRADKPCGDHEFPRWRWTEYVVVLSLIGSAVGVIVAFTLGLTDHRPATSMIAYSIAAGLGTGFITWARTEGIFGYVPRTSEFSSYLEYRKQELRQRKTQ